MKKIIVTLAVAVMAVATTYGRAYPRPNHFGGSRYYHHGGRGYYHGGGSYWGRGGRNFWPGFIAGAAIGAASRGCYGYPGPVIVERPILTSAVAAVAPTQVVYQQPVVEQPVYVQPEQPVQRVVYVQQPTLPPQPTVYQPTQTTTTTVVVPSSREQKRRIIAGVNVLGVDASIGF